MFEYRCQVERWDFKGPIERLHLNPDGSHEWRYPGTAFEPADAAILAFMLGQIDKGNTYKVITL